MRMITMLASALISTLIAAQTIGCAADAPHNAADSAKTGSAASAKSADAKPEAGAADELRRLIGNANNLPLPPGNYRIEIERVWVTDADSWEIGALFGAVDEHAAVQVGRPDADAGFRIGVERSGAHGELAAALRKFSRADRSSMQLVAAPGAPASLQMGEMRYAVPLKLAGSTAPLIVPKGQILGASLQVLLTPVFSGLGAQGETLTLSQMTSTATVPLGQSMLIASQRRDSHDVASTLLSRSLTSNEEQGVLVLTVTGG